MLSDDLGSQFAETDLASAMADINPGDEDLVAAMLADVVKPPGRVDLYDSGSTQHLSPYRDQFLTYEKFLPNPLLLRISSNLMLSDLGRW